MRQPSNRMSYQISKAVFGATALVFTAGCATGGSNLSSDEKSAAEKSQVYLEKTSLVRAQNTPSAISCVVPSEAEKPAPGTQAGPSKDWKNFVSYANACVAAKNWKNLETIANAIARNDIDSPWGTYFLGLAAEGQGDFARAAWMIDLAQKKSGGQSGLFAYQKGRLLLRVKQTAKAMVEIKRAVEIEPALIDGHLLLAEIYHRDQETDRALTHYNAVLSAEAKNYRALMGLGEIKLAQNSAGEAATFFERAVASRPDDLRPWLRLVHVHETVAKNPELALNAYKGLKASLDKGSVKERPDFDLNGKIKALEDQVSARKPAQAAVIQPEKARSTK